MQSHGQGGVPGAQGALPWVHVVHRAEEDGKRAALARTSVGMLTVARAAAWTCGGVRVQVSCQQIFVSGDYLRAAISPVGVWVGRG